MLRTVYTVVNEAYAGFVPAWAYTARQVWPDVHVAVGLTVGVELATALWIEGLGVEIAATPYGTSPSCLRFLLTPPTADEVLITDADVVFLTSDVWPALREKMTADGLRCYGAFQGAWTLPKDPKNAPGGWHGDMQRLTGGHVLVTSEWYTRTEAQRKFYLAALSSGAWGTFREADEVMLCRICQDAVHVLPSVHRFPPTLRGLHVGDFRPSMVHRYTDKAKMKKLLPEDNAARVAKLLKDPEFLRCIDTEDKLVTACWEAIRSYVS